MISLKEHVKNEAKISGLPPREAKEDVANCLDIGISTLYLWLKSGKYYVESSTALQAGDTLTVWKLEKNVT